MNTISKVLILTVAYGQGHKSAAAGLEEEYISRGCKVLVLDPCEADITGIYALTKAYYKLCVRRAPWLWAMAYSQTDTADWSKMVRWPVIRTATDYLIDTVISWRPDIVLCTYPLYAYMMDYLHAEHLSEVPYGVVVTDSLEISRPWVKSRSPFLFVPDEHSAALLRERYGLSDSVVINTGFPVRKKFYQSSDKCAPTNQKLNILYGAYLSVDATTRQVRELFARFPQAKIVLLAGDRYARLKKSLGMFELQGKLTIMHSTEKMSELFDASHIYIGKTGAATMFEAYASGVPFIANYALPGQEQGNLQLLIRDNAGCWAGTSGELCAVIRDLLRNNAAAWKTLRSNMQAYKCRVYGASRIADILEEHLS